MQNLDQGQARQRVVVFGVISARLINYRHVRRAQTDRLQQVSLLCGKLARRQGSSTSLSVSLLARSRFCT